MGKGGGQTATQTTVQDVPAWAKPYYEDILKKSKAASEQPYVPYGGQRLAQVGQDITASQQMIRNIAGRPAAGLGEAMSTLSSLGAQAQQLGQQRPAQFSEAQFTPYGGFKAGVATPFTEFEAGVARAQQYDPARQFSGQEVSTYMSPYMQAVVDREKASAIQEFERQRGSRAARARNIICSTVGSLPLEQYNHFTNEHIRPNRVIMQPDPPFTTVIARITPPAT